MKTMAIAACTANTMTRKRIGWPIVAAGVGSWHGQAGPQRPPHPGGRVIPPPGETRVSHARGRSRDLRGPAHPPRRVRSGLGVAAAPGAALPPEAGLPALRDGTADLDRRPELQRRVPRAPHGAARPRLRGAAPPARGPDLLPA